MLPGCTFWAIARTDMISCRACDAGQACHPHVTEEETATREGYAGC